MSTETPLSRGPNSPDEGLRPAGPPISRRTALLGAVSAAVAVGCSTSTPRAGGSGSTTTPANPSTTEARTARPTSTTTSAAPLNGGPAEFVASGPPTPPHIALTFHTDGDVGLANQLLDLLAARRVHVTTFLVGKWVDAHPDIVRRIRQDGHELANHTYSHVTFAKLAPAVMTQEVERCRDALIRATGDGGRLFRPSGTENGTQAPPDAVLAAAGTGGYPTVVGFDVDPRDYQDPGATVVAQRVDSSLHAGAIVSLHFGHPGTITALPAILDAVSSRGLQVVTASELLA